MVSVRWCVCDSHRPARDEHDSFGVGLALTISLHNIPEGLAVAVPIAYTTRSRFWTIVIPFLTGLFEPLGAIVAGLFLRPYITEER